jgi:hypothetical protein
MASRLRFHRRNPTAARCIIEKHPSFANFEGHGETRQRLGLRQSPAAFCSRIKTGRCSKPPKFYQHIQQLSLLPGGEGQDEGKDGAHFKWCGPEIWMTTSPSPRPSPSGRGRNARSVLTWECAGRFRVHSRNPTAALCIIELAEFSSGAAVVFRPALFPWAQMRGAPISTAAILLRA